MSKFGQFKLDLKGMSAGMHTFEYHLDKQFFVNMECSEVRDADVTVTLTVDFRQGIYDLKFALVGTLTVACDRCLDDLELPVDATYTTKVKYGDRFCDDADDLIEIPSTETSLNVAYMIYDTAVLAIPVKHVHPLGKCNRAMSALLKKHRVGSVGDPDSELEEQLIDEIDQLADSDTDTDGDATDPRWDKLKEL